MEDLIIGLLFLYFFVLRPILKQVRKKDAEAKEDAKVRPPLRGLFDAVRAKMQEIAEEAEAVRREKARRRPGGPPRELFSGAAREPEAGHREPSWEAVPPPEPTPPLVQARPPDNEEPIPEPARPRVDLRQAVVWAEILGAPVSLRDGGWK